jgi:hypothetical protein
MASRPCVTLRRPWSPTCRDVNGLSLFFVIPDEVSTII